MKTCNSYFVLFFFTIISPIIDQKQRTLQDPYIYCFLSGSGVYFLIQQTLFTYFPSVKSLLCSICLIGGYSPCQLMQPCTLYRLSKLLCFISLCTTYVLLNTSLVGINRKRKGNICKMLHINCSCKTTISFSNFPWQMNKIQLQVPLYSQLNCFIPS